VVNVALPNLQSSLAATGAQAQWVLSPGTVPLLIGRCLQGIGGALLVPNSLALLSARFQGAARGRAIGTWPGFASIMTAFGPVLGGWMVQRGSWRAVFFLNVPIALVTPSNAHLWTRFA
jgi:MFS family permease